MVFTFNFKSESESESVITSKIFSRTKIAVRIHLTRQTKTPGFVSRTGCPRHNTPLFGKYFSLLFHQIALIGVVFLAFVDGVNRIVQRSNVLDVE